MDTTGTPAEFAQLLDLAARRTPGQIRARAASLQLGGSQIDGFPQAADADYLAQAANVLPKLVAQLLSARGVVQDQVEEIGKLRLAQRSLQEQALAAQREYETLQALLRRARRRIRQLKRQVNVRPKVIQVSPARQEVVHYQTVKAPATWMAPDGHQYELVYVPQQPDVTEGLQEALP
jgi:hypothetical protein